MFAVARISGASAESKLRGFVYFKDVRNGTEVYVEVTGLPAYKPAEGNNPPIGPHGFHIHGVGNCDIGDLNKPFTSSGEHWNPKNQPHGNHAGDFPVLFSNNGYARMSFFTNKFKVRDVIGKSVIIHENPDDYRTQPAGASGKRIGCGVIKSIFKARHYEAPAPSSYDSYSQYSCPYFYEELENEQGYNDYYDTH